MSFWAIIDTRTREIRATGLTEGQAWIAYLGYRGKAFTVTHFLFWVELYQSRCGLTAVEFPRSC